MTQPEDVHISLEQANREGGLDKALALYRARLMSAMNSVHGGRGVSILRDAFDLEEDTRPVYAPPRD